MSVKKTIGFVALMLTVGVSVTVGLLYTSDEEADEIVARYNKATQDFRQTTVTTTVANVQEDENEPAINIPGNSNSVAPNDSWISICDSVHKQWGASGLTYAYGREATATYNGQQYTVRQDCSGYVGFCLYIAGLATSTTPITSGTTVGFVQSVGGAVVEQSAVQKGDILVYTGHVEIFDHIGEDGCTYVYNWGGTSSTSALYAGKNPAEVNSVTRTGRPLSSATIVRIPNFEGN